MYFEKKKIITVALFRYDIILFREKKVKSTFQLFLHFEST